MINKTTKRRSNRSQNQLKSNRQRTAAPAPKSVQAGSAATPQVSPNRLSAARFEAEVQRPLENRRAQVKSDPSADELVNSILDSQNGPQGAPGPRKGHRLIKLGIDVHAERYVVVRQLDGATPQPAQSFTPKQFMVWAQKQTQLAEQVYSCYEAGPFGYGLHRRLTALGVTNYVVRPRDWDQYGQKVKTDKRDARELVLNLDRYVAGNGKAFSVVRVPTEAEEQARSRSRLRETLQKHKQRLAAQGRSHGLYYAVRVEGEWWTQKTWKELVLPPIVLELLEPLRRLILAVDEELQASTQALIQTETAQPLPVGLGKLTYEILEREVGDWNRFNNRRQVASYTGMCPREDSSDQRRFQGSINKHGNPRVRTPLVEASWRLIRFQPTYQAVAKWRAVLLNSKTTKSKRKQIAVAIGRQFSVDWWRVRTGRCQLEELGLVVKPPPVVVEPTRRAKGCPEVLKA